MCFEQSLARGSQSTVVTESVYDKTFRKDFECPICLSLLQDPFVTRCGHTFCHGCLDRQLKTVSKCPACSSSLERRDIFPNFLINKVGGFEFET